jgi:hypothetical protein
MPLQPAIKIVFVQLSDSLKSLSDEEYVKHSAILFNATIGQHVRHIIELFLCLEKGYETGVVNYEQRKRDLRIQNDKDFANGLLHDIYSRLNRQNKGLLLEGAYDEHSAELVSIDTNYYREIAYNLEHTIHHMALIRVGINEVSDVILPEGYGVASSTIKFQKACAQ